MAQVSTVTGSIDTADLGPTLMHEHVNAILSGVRKSSPDLLAVPVEWM